MTLLAATNIINPDNIDTIILIVGSILVWVKSKLDKTRHQSLESKVDNAAVKADEAAVRAEEIKEEVKSPNGTSTAQSVEEIKQTVKSFHSDLETLKEAGRNFASRQDLMLFSSDIEEVKGAVQSVASHLDDFKADIMEDLAEQRKEIAAVAKHVGIQSRAKTTARSSKVSTKVPAKVPAKKVSARVIKKQA